MLMTDVSAKSVMHLRARTGLGVMECKQALEQSKNDVDQAIDYLRRASKLKTAKKSERVAAEGIVLTGVDKSGSYGVIFELNSETDFVAREKHFLDFATHIMDEALRTKEQNLETLMSGDLEEARQRLIQKVGENIRLRCMRAIEAPKGCVAGYTHSNKRIATLLGMRGGDVALAHDIAMHVAATAPTVLQPSDMPEELVAKEREIYMAQSADSNKTADIVEKIVAGKIKKYVDAASLLEQPFVKNPEQKIGALLKDAQAEVLEFVRYEVGEGMEKNDTNFVAEVAAQATSHQST